MCLGVPGRVTRWIDRDPTFGKAEVEFDGIRRTCHMACVPDATEGDYVIVHAGIAISRIDADEAQRLIEELQQFGLADELAEIQNSAPRVSDEEAP